MAASTAAGGRLAGKVALITGMASGIGAASARRFAREGASVAGFDLNEPDAELAAELAETAPKTSFRRLDVRDEDAIVAAVGETVAAFGRIDVLVGAAGVSGAGAVGDLDADEWDRVLDINLKGVFLVSKHVVRHMAERGEGSIIHLASIEGLEAMSQQAAYNASKAGVVLLTRNMALDYGPLGVRVNCLCPGLIDTPMTAILNEKELGPIRNAFVKMHALKRAGRPEEVAAAALFLASDDASFVTGAALTVDGGFTAGRSLGDFAV